MKTKNDTKSEETNSQLTTKNNTKSEETNSQLTTKNNTKSEETNSQLTTKDNTIKTRKPKTSNRVNLDKRLKRVRNLRMSELKGMRDEEISPEHMGTRKYLTFYGFAWRSLISPGAEPLDTHRIERFSIEYVILTSPLNARKSMPDLNFLLSGLDKYFDGHINCAVSLTVLKSLSSDDTEEIGVTQRLTGGNAFYVTKAIHEILDSLGGPLPDSTEEEENFWPLERERLVSVRLEGIEPRRSPANTQHFINNTLLHKLPHFKNTGLTRLPHPSSPFK